MSAKAMVFIDGTWLYKCRSAIFAKAGEETGFEIDYAKMPKLLCEDVADRLDEDISLVRTMYFGTIPANRGGYGGKQNAFYDFLERSCNYETHIHEVDVANGEGRGDTWVKVSLASSLMFFAAQPGAFDIAIIVSDDADYVPALRRVRLLGKRVQCVGMRPMSDVNIVTSLNCRRATDFAPLYLDDHASDIKLVREEVVRVCKICGREESTTWAGPDFFCQDCRSNRKS